MKENLRATMRARPAVNAASTHLRQASPRAEHCCRNLPLSFCESQYTKLNPISVTTLTSLMEALTKAVETTIGEEMPDDFGLIIDGWTHVPATVTSPGDGRARRSPQC
ncbi:hypothetical protein PC119_g16410 [Phytophthora cactorum]|nr:hypothetical protein PC119_g16410 [Phytophthora cactorum]